MRPHVEHALRRKGVRYNVRGSTPSELRYEVSVPLDEAARQADEGHQDVDNHEEICDRLELRKPKVADVGGARCLLFSPDSPRRAGARIAGARRDVVAAAARLARRRFGCPTPPPP